MPIFEYQCSECGATFERLVLQSQAGTPACTVCDSTKTVKRFSTFSTHAGTTVSTSSTPTPAFR